MTILNVKHEMHGASVERSIVTWDALMTEGDVEGILGIVGTIEEIEDSHSKEIETKDQEIGDLTEETEKLRDGLSYWRERCRGLLKAARDYKARGSKRLPKAVKPPKKPRKATRRKGK